MNPAIRLACALILATSIAAATVPWAYSDPVGPPPVPPPGTLMGPPGWAPAPKVGAPPVFANTHGPTDSRGTRASANVDPAEAGIGLPGSVLGEPKAPSQNLGPNHGVGPLGGFEAAPPHSNGGGTNAGTIVPPLEDPHGQPLQDVPYIPPPPTVKPPPAIG